MSLLSEARPNLQIALRLATFDKSSVEDFKDDDRAFWLSFWAIPLAFVIEIVQGPLAARSIESINVEPGGSPLTIGWLVVGWLLALNLTAGLAQVLGRTERWPRMAIALNWCAVIQSAVQAAALVLLALLGASEGLYRLAIVAAFIWSLAYDWHVIKYGLDIDGLPAAMAVIMMLAAQLFVIGLGPAMFAS